MTYSNIQSTTRTCTRVAAVCILLCATTASARTLRGSTKAHIFQALAKRGAALTAKNYGQLALLYNDHAQLAQYMAAEGKTAVYNGPEECSQMYVHQPPLGEVYTWTKQVYAPLRLFHKVGTGSTFPNVVIETQIYDENFKMLQQYVVLAPKKASFDTDVISQGTGTIDTSSPLQTAYRRHHDAGSQGAAGLTVLGQGYANNAEMYQYVASTNHTATYKGVGEIVGMFAGLIKAHTSDLPTAPASKVWKIAFNEDLRLVWVVMGKGAQMIVDVLVFNEQYQIVRQYPAIMPIN